jgi:hypothetical protein
MRPPRDPPSTRPSARVRLFAVALDGARIEPDRDAEIGSVRSRTRLAPGSSWRSIRWPTACTTSTRRPRPPARAPPPGRAARRRARSPWCAVGCGHDALAVVEIAEGERLLEPGIGGTTGVEPVASTRWSYGRVRHPRSPSWPRGRCAVTAAPMRALARVSSVMSEGHACPPTHWTARSGCRPGVAPHPRLSRPNWTEGRRAARPPCRIPR